jgi:hypothetical protein
MGDVLLVYVEPEPGNSLGDVRAAARSNACDVMVYNGTLMPVSETVDGGEPYPRIDPLWLLRCRRWYSDDQS